jgi:hypothetical protein
MNNIKNNANNVLIKPTLCSLHRFESSYFVSVLLEIIVETNNHARQLPAQC